MGKMVTFMLCVFSHNFWTLCGSVRTPGAGHPWSAQKLRRSAWRWVWFPQTRAAARALRSNEHPVPPSHPRLWSVSTHRTLPSPNVCGEGPPLTRSPSPLQLGLPQFNSVLTLSTRSSRPTPQTKGSIPQNGPHSGCQDF